MEFGQFARHGDAPAGQMGFDLLQAFDDAVRAFEEDQRCLQMAELGEEAALVAILLGEEAEEAETVGRKPREGERRRDRRGAGATGDWRSLRCRFRRKPITRIGNQRHASIADKCDRLSRLEPCEDAGANLRGIVLVIGLEPVADGEAFEEFRRGAGVFTEDGVGGGQRFKAADRHVAQIADGRRHDMEARCECPALQNWRRRWHSGVCDLGFRLS